MATEGETMLAQENGKKRKLHGRAFYESIGSPKLVLAPMVEQSEFVCLLLQHSNASRSLTVPSSQAWRLLSRSFLPESQQKNLLAYTPMFHSKMFGEKSNYRDAHFQPLKSTVPLPVDDYHLSQLPDSDRYLDGNPAFDRPLTVQFCSNDPDDFLRAAKHVAPFCDAVDLNLGCPQGIAKRGKYGAFLQEDWHLISSMIRKLHEELDVPVTAKMRVLETAERTLAYAKTLLDAGASIITVHGRRREQKGHNTGLADWKMIRHLRENLPKETVIFANGNILQHEDIAACLEATGADGVMSAEGNLYDPTIFAPPPPLGQEGREYWRGRDGKGGYRMDAVMRRYMDIIHRYALGQEPPQRKPLWMPGDNAEEQQPAEQEKDRSEDEEGPPKKKRKQMSKSEKKKEASNPNLTAMQAHLFHLLRPLVAEHHNVRDALARSRTADIDAFENVLALVEKAVKEGIQRYEEEHANDTVPVANDSAPVTNDTVPVANDSAPVTNDTVPVANDTAPVTPSTEAAPPTEPLDPYESSLATVARVKRPYWVCQPYVRPLPKEAIEKGSMTVSKKEKKRREMAAELAAKQGDDGVRDAGLVPGGRVEEEVLVKENGDVVETVEEPREGVAIEEDTLQKKAIEEETRLNKAIQDSHVKLQRLAAERLAAEWHELQARTIRSKRLERMYYQILWSKQFAGTIHMDTAAGYEDDEHRLRNIAALVENGIAIVYWTDGAFGLVRDRSGVLGAGATALWGSQKYDLWLNGGRWTGDCSDAELLGLSLALRHAADLVGQGAKFKLIRIFTDSLSALKALNWDHPEKIYLGPLIPGDRMAIERVISDSIWLYERNIKVEVAWVKGHYKSAGNIMADRLAQRAVSYHCHDQKIVYRGHVATRIAMTADKAPAAFKALGQDWVDEWLFRANAEFLEHQDLFEDKTPIQAKRAPWREMLLTSSYSLAPPESPKLEASGETKDGETKEEEETAEKKPLNTHIRLLRVPTADGRYDFRVASAPYPSKSTCDDIDFLSRSALKDTWAGDGDGRVEFGIWRVSVHRRENHSNTPFFSLSPLISFTIILSPHHSPPPPPTMIPLHPLTPPPPPSSPLTHSFAIPGPDSNHLYKPAVSHFSLLNPLFKDPYHPTQNRHLMASLFLPIPRDLCKKECSIPYMPAMTAAIANEQFIVGGKRDVGVFETMDYSVCCGGGGVDASKIPVVVLEGNVDTSRLLYQTMARYVSANGVAVVLVDHPGDASIVQYTSSSATSSRIRRRDDMLASPDVYNSGTVPLSNFSPLTAWNSTIDLALSTRRTDILFVLEQISTPAFLTQHFPNFATLSVLNTSSVGFIGHGLGGTLATSFSLTPSTTTSTSFSINLSGAAPPLNKPTSNPPLYFFGRTPSFRRESALNWASLWSHLTGRISTEFDVVNAGIFDMSDLPIVVEVARNEGGKGGVRARGVGEDGGVGATHAVWCFLENVVKGVLGLEGAGVDLGSCVRGFGGVVVPYPGV
ncbi:trna-dihydrouridine synthase 1 [Pyrenophora seminiperda CCB06]|uniref:tRNA-dihydrouridine(16/17) synthase [NAD(P)(+)] n=1 Tax=Pyrenophora seminiperda CCB06 TaxID=1302712 RepID=A0A3M7MFI4_9PLEO|nr:trna-dihydrouridine synthase 1 [Pyrenophora seminiperda CCB06]